MAKTLGLDLGVASIGWCLYESEKLPRSDNQGEVEKDVYGNFKYKYVPQHIIDLGVFVFNQIEDGKSGKTENVHRREKRLMRRQRRRKVRRLASLRYLFFKYFQVDFLKDIIENRHCKLTPFEIKVKGLKEKLSEEELMIALYHYMKFRGFQSNRKAKDENNKDSEKMLGKINDTRKELEERNMDITELLLTKSKERIEEEPYNNKIHNSDDENYIMAVSRDMYETEINKLLDKQIEYGVINEEFKNEFLEIYKKRRSYTEGPNNPSPFKVDLEEKIGKCFVYKDENRAPKDSLTAQRFLLLSKLANFKYKYFNSEHKEEYLSLTADQIKKAESKLIYEKSIKYSKLLRTLNINSENIEIKGLILTKKEYIKLRKSFVQKEKIESELKIEDQKDLKDKFYKECQKQLLGKTFFTGSILINEVYKNHKIKDDLKTDDFYDNVANTFLVKKDDNEIFKKLKELSFDDDIINELLTINADATQTINLSIKLCKELLPHLRKGLVYDKAMKACGHNHSDKMLDENDGDGFVPPIDEALKVIGVTLNNPVVKNTLVQLRKILNAIKKEYGEVDDCVVELARELKLSFAERQNIMYEQLDNQSNNNLLKNEMIEKYPNKFNSYNSISKDDLNKYKLFKDQNGICVYTNEKINERQLFDDRVYEVDHIIPYHLSFDDSYSNKVLVTAKANQDKGMRIPTQCPYIIENVKSFLKKNPNISSAKRNNLLKTEVDEKFKNRDLNDTSYLSKIARNLITYFVLKKGHVCRSTNGRITSFLKTHWGLSGKTHTYHKLKDGTYASFENKMYQSKFYDDFKLATIDRLDNNDGIKFSFENGKNKNSIEIKKAKVEDEKKLSEEQKHLNEAIDDFLNCYMTTFRPFDGENNWRYKSIEEIQKLIAGDHISIDGDTTSTYNSHKDYALLILGKIRVEIQKIIDKKNRNNDLHHALDAAVIGVCNPSMIQKISSANVRNNTDKIIFEQPYKDFDKEVLIRVYEHDENKILTLLNRYVEYYKYNPLSKYDVHILIPVRQPNHNISGALTKETIYGVKQDVDGVLKATKKVNVKKIKKEDIEKIVDKNSGNKAVYESIKEWFKNKKVSEYPQLKVKGTFIKSVKIYDSPVKGKVSLSNKNNRFADNDSVVRVEIYKKKDLNNKTLYFVPIYYYQVLRRLSNDKDKINYTLIYNQGSDGFDICNGLTLIEKYKLISVLPRYSFIQISVEDKQGNENNGFAYSGGVSGGFFEIYSLIGDCLDDRYYFNTNRKDDRVLLSCNMVRKIKVRSISVLGKIS